MISAKLKDAATENNQELAAMVRAGCFDNEAEALREAVQTMPAVKPQLRMEAAIRRYLDGEITLGRAAELSGVTRWRFQELPALRGVQLTLEAAPATELDDAVERLRRRRS